MNRFRRLNILLAGAVGVVVGLSLLSGCSAAKSGEEYVGEEPAYAAADEAPAEDWLEEPPPNDAWEAEEPAAPNDETWESASDDGAFYSKESDSSWGALDAERKIARTAAVSLVVEDVAETSSKLHNLAFELGGMIANEKQTLPTEESDRGWARVEVVVSPDALDEALRRITDLGDVVELKIESADVTDQVVDVNSRVQTMRDSIERVRDLMSKTGTIKDIAQVEAELTRRQAELESLLARKASLSRRVQTAPIDVEVTTKKKEEPKKNVREEESSGFLSGLKSGWTAFLDFGGGLLAAVGTLLPWLIPITIIAVPATLVLRKRIPARKTRAAKAPDDSPPEEDPDASAPSPPDEAPSTEPSDED